MIRSLLGQKLPTKAQDLIMKAVSPTNILKILRDYDGANQNGGMVLAPSFLCICCEIQNDHYGPPRTMWLVGKSNQYATVWEIYYFRQGISIDSFGN